jgi:hypothetical protein
MIPSPVIELHEADAVLDQAPGQQAVVGEGRIVALVDDARIVGALRG